MDTVIPFIRSTIGRKVVMAVTGLALVLFVLGHMVGNLQIFLGPDVINAYAHKLQTLPPVLLWGFRAGMLALVVLHVWAALSLVLDNVRARPERYDDNSVVQATLASRTMRVTGGILLAFIVFHIAHFTLKAVPGHDYGGAVPLVKHGEVVAHADGTPVLTHDVYTMMVRGFETWWISAFYLVATALLCFHLSHGVSSMFQTVGLSNKVWRKRLDCLAALYGWIVFLGFAVIPVAVLAGWLQPAAAGNLEAERPVAQLVVRN